MLTANERTWRRWAYRTFTSAMRRNVLPDPKKLRCTDCGKQAHGYDHRDYSKPLEVQPTCTSCNHRRGKGWSPAWAYDGRYCFIGEHYPNWKYAKLTPLREKYEMHHGTRKAPKRKRGSK